MLRIHFRFTVAHAPQRVPTIQFFYSVRGKGGQDYFALSLRVSSGTGICSGDTGE